MKHYKALRVRNDAQADDTSLPSRLQSAVQAKQKDKQTISQLEKRLKAEQEARAAAEKQLAEERKRKKMEEAIAARAVALAAATRCLFLFLLVTKQLFQTFKITLSSSVHQGGVDRFSPRTYQRAGDGMQEAQHGHEAQGGAD